MLVEVTQLRRDGTKLTPDEIKAQPAWRGHLQLHRGVARLTAYPDNPPTVGDVIPPLEGCMVHRISQDGMVLHGEERPLVDRFRYGPAQPQAWWVRLVPWQVEPKSLA